MKGGGGVFQHYWKVVVIVGSVSILLEITQVAIERGSFDHVHPVYGYHPLACRHPSSIVCCIPPSVQEAS